MPRRLRHLALLFAATGWLLGTPVLGDAQAAPPDIVRLQSGGLLRGTIVESVPGEKVVIQLVTGELREIPASEVVYAGPAAEEPPASTAVFPRSGDTPPPPVPSAVAPGPTSANANVRLESDVPGYTLHLRTGVSQAGNVIIVGMRRVCTAPCAGEVPPGRWPSFVDFGDGRYRNAGMVDFSPGTYRIERRSRFRLRLITSIVMGVAAVAGIGMLAVGFANQSNSDSFDEIGTIDPLTIAGASVLSAGVFGGTMLLVFGGRDRPRVVRVSDAAPAAF
ncbi:MAG: hypothetical protein AAGH15_06570 [Myxococcota bacterium]